MIKSFPFPKYTKIKTFLLMKKEALPLLENVRKKGEIGLSYHNQLNHFLIQIKQSQ